LSNRLRLQIINEYGLVEAIKWQIQNFTKLKGVKIKFKISIKETILNKNEGLTIFRIFQEILTNIMRHSEATVVNISFFKKNSEIILEVIDNGVGFELSKLNQINAHGIIGMQERAVSIGAKFTIKSEVSVGTTVILSFNK